RNGGFEAFESIDGKLLYFLKQVKRLWSLPVEGGDETLVLDPAPAGNWAVTSNGSKRFASPHKQTRTRLHNRYLSRHPGGTYEVPCMFRKAGWRAFRQGVSLGRLHGVR